MSMKLICELNEDVEILVEEDKETKKKNYFIEGIFMQGDIKNRNGRRYPFEILEKEVSRYVKNYVEKNKAWGELGHPNGPIINLPLVSHMIVSLKRSGTDFVGKAKIMGTPNGEIVKNLLDEGASLGVSSRGMGSLKKNGRVSEVQKDFYLATAGDIVADPSAPNAFVNGIMEGKEWIWEKGVWKEAHVAAAKTKIKKTPAKELDSVKIEVFESFMNHISKT